MNKAIFVEPNCTTVFYADVPETAVRVRMGKILDGVSPHMSEYPDQYTFVVGKEPEPTKDDIVRILKESGAEVLLNYLPVGSEEATRFYAECALGGRRGLYQQYPGVYCQRFAMGEAV